MTALTNTQMKPNRFARYARARKMVNFIQTNLAKGLTVQIIVSSIRTVNYKGRAHIESFKADKTGAYVKRGKSWDCIDYVQHIRAF